MNAEIMEEHMIYGEAQYLVQDFIIIQVSMQKVHFIFKSIQAELLQTLKSNKLVIFIRLITIRNVYHQFILIIINPWIELGNYYRNRFFKLQRYDVIHFLDQYTWNRNRSFLRKNTKITQVEMDIIKLTMT